MPNSRVAYIRSIMTLPFEKHIFATYHGSKCAPRTADAHEAKGEIRHRRIPAESKMRLK